MRQVAKNHVGVTRETYKTVYNRDGGRCALCNENRPEALQLHHIKTRHNKALINDPANCIMLCAAHHRTVHENMRYWEPVLSEIVKRREDGRKQKILLAEAE